MRKKLACDALSVEVTAFVPFSRIRKRVNIASSCEKTDFWLFLRIPDIIVTQGKSHRVSARFSCVQRTEALVIANCHSIVII